MNGIEKLKQLTYIYRIALDQGIASDNWVERLREKMNDYGRNLIITASELEEYPSFLEWVADKVPGATEMEGNWVFYQYRHSVGFASVSEK